MATTQQSYLEFLDYSIGLPIERFDIRDSNLHFEGIDLLALAQEHGTPLRFTYLPVIGRKIGQARQWFAEAMKDIGYQGSYTYCYCTKSNHFQHTLREVFRHGVNMEVSSENDTLLVRQMEAQGLIGRTDMILANGFKPRGYFNALLKLIQDGFTGIVPVVDNEDELEQWLSADLPHLGLGMRIAIAEPAEHDCATTRFGMPPEMILELYRSRIKDHPSVKLQMLHFFVQSGVKNTEYYWGELDKCVSLYCNMKQENPHLHQLNLGGGMPYKNSLMMEFNYAEIIREIVSTIHQICRSNGVPEPDLVTEFGTYTVAEASGILYNVLARKVQNGLENWLMLDGSIMSSIPDVWGMGARFIVLPLNGYHAPFERVILGGITCDSGDIYSEVVHGGPLRMPKAEALEDDLFLGFFHTGAYQESLSGVGGIHHCLLPTPKHVVLNRTEDGQLTQTIVTERQGADEVLRILGYT